MRRRQLAEIIDQPWCPAVLRRGVTEYLQALARVSRPYDRAVPLLAEAMIETGARRVIDIGSGAGGPWPDLGDALAERLGGALEVVATDLHPEPSTRLEATPLGRCTFRRELEPVDARSVPARLAGFRTFFSVFHHFDDEDAKAALADAVAAGGGVGVFEVTRRSWLALAMMLTTPMPAFLLTLTIRPWSLTRLALTYLVPLLPLVTAFDGVVSCLRTRAPAELLALVDDVEGSERYRWSAGEVSAFPPSPIPVTYLLGTPRAGRGRE